jgi:hypothetical protein
VNYKSNIALGYVLAILGVLILTLVVGLSGCTPRRERIVVPRECEDHCGEYQTVSPPALIVTPSASARPLFPWSRRAAHTEAIPVVPVEPGVRAVVPPEGMPVVPVEPGAHVVVPSCVDDFDAEAEAVFAYAAIDMPCVTAD